jgi:hypothetical protein
MAKTLRAINDNCPVEVWAPGNEAGDTNAPSGHPISQIFHGEICATHGGFGSFGYGQPSIPQAAAEYRALSEALDPVAPYVGGEPVAPIGLVLSGATKDFDQMPPGVQAVSRAKSLRGCFCTGSRPRSAPTPRTMSSSIPGARATAWCCTS